MDLLYSDKQAFIKRLSRLDTFRSMESMYTFIFVADQLAACKVAKKEDTRKRA